MRTNYLLEVPRPHLDSSFPVQELQDGTYQCTYPVRMEHEVKAGLVFIVNFEQQKVVRAKINLKWTEFCPYLNILQRIKLFFDYKSLLEKELETISLEDTLNGIRCYRNIEESAKHDLAEFHKYHELGEIPNVEILPVAHHSQEDMEYRDLLEEMDKEYELAGIYSNVIPFHRNHIPRKKAEIIVLKRN